MVLEPVERPQQIAGLRRAGGQPPPAGSGGDAQLERPPVARVARRRAGGGTPGRRSPPARVTGVSRIAVGHQHALEPGIQRPGRPGRRFGGRCEPWAGADAPAAPTGPAPGRPRPPRSATRGWPAAAPCACRSVRPSTRRSSRTSDTRPSAQSALPCADSPSPVTDRRSMPSSRSCCSRSCQAGRGGRPGRFAPGQRLHLQRRRRQVRLHRQRAGAVAMLGQHRLQRHRAGQQAGGIQPGGGKLRRIRPAGHRHPLHHLGGRPGAKVHRRIELRRRCRPASPRPSRSARHSSRRGPACPGPAAARPPRRPDAPRPDARRHGSRPRPC